MGYYHFVLAAYWVLVGGILLWGFILERRFTGYLSREHPGKWRALLDSARGRPALIWPKEPMTVSGFLWRSQEDFGDAEIRRYRSRLRSNRKILILFFVGGLLGFGTYFVFRR